MKFDLCHTLYKPALAAGIILCISGFYSSQTFAQGTIKIGVVDVQKVYNAWSEKKAADKEFEPLRSKVEQKRKAFSDAQAEYRKKSPTAIKPEVKQEEEKKLRALQQDLQETYSEAMKKIDAKAQELSEKLDDILNNAYKDLSKKEHYTLIMDIRTVRYFDPSVVTDITDQVTDYVNSSTKKEEPKKK